MPAANSRGLPNEPFVTENYVKGAYKELFIMFAKLELKINKLIIPKEGERGKLGEKGNKGDKGEMGPNGEKGNLGITGTRGSRGERGLTGEKGPIGMMGIKGELGPKGKNGEDGISEVIHKFDLTQIKEVKTDLNKISSQIEAIQMKLNKKSRWKFWS